MKRGDQPEGVDLIRNALRVADDLAAKVVAAKQRKVHHRTLASVTLKHARAMHEVYRLIALGSCARFGCTLPHPTPVEPELPASPATAPDTTHLDVLDDTALPVVWRIAVMLLGNERLDYTATAERLYGKTQYPTGKNRINSHVTRLKTLGIVQPLGHSRFRVNADKLISKLGLTEELGGAP